MIGVPLVNDKVYDKFNIYFTKDLFSILFSNEAFPAFL